MRVTELEPRPEGRYAERPAPATLPSRAVMMLDVYGSLYSAGAKTLSARLPEPGGSVQPGVVLRLRGRTRLGATSVVVIEGYAKRVADVGGRLFLSGVDPDLADQLAHTGTLAARGDVHAYPVSAAGSWRIHRPSRPSSVAITWPRKAVARKQSDRA